MRWLEDGEVLALWERTRSRGALDRALAILEAVGEPGDPEPASLSIGGRDVALLRFRCGRFGERMPCAAACAECGEPLEFDVDVPSLLDTIDHPVPPRVTVAADEWRVTARVPDSRLVARAGGDPAALLMLCLEDVVPPDGVHDTRLPDAVRLALESELEAVDPAADLRLLVECPACRASWRAPLDVLSCVMADLEVAAERLLHEVHVLARAYGWSEAVILGLAPRRRRQYLTLVAG